MSLLVRGGPVMIPIIALSVVALAIVFERVRALRGARLDLPAFADRVFGLLRAGDAAGALAECGGMRHPVGGVFAEGIRHRGLPREQLERLMERAGEAGVHDLGRHLRVLLVIVGIEPMLGFLGTITGLIRAFMAWEELGARVTVGTLAGGIYEAMITTAAGLIVAIPHFLAYHLIAGRIQDHARATGFWGERLLDLLTAPRAGRRP